MKIDLHDSIFSPNGASFLDKDASKILLKKRHTGAVYTPKEGERSPGAMYPRAILLEHNGAENGTILCTFEQYTYDTPVFSIYASEDNGLTWQLRSKVEDTQKGWGCRYQPQLFELPCKCGELEAGTILCAGNIIPDDFSKTLLHIYKSTDGGRSWEFMSEIAAGGPARTDAPDLADEDRPVWEPFLAVNKKNELICYYSDEGYFHSQNCNQLLLHKVSKDGGYTWGPAVIDVAMPDGQKRPGMPIIAEMPNGQYIMVYEVVNLDSIPVFFRLSDDLENWGDPEFLGNPVRCADGSYITGTPYVIWLNKGGENGTLLVSGRGYGGILANSNLGKGNWEKLDGMIDVDFNCGFTSYSRCMLPINGGKQLLALSPRQINPKLAQIEYAIADVYEKCE